MGRLKMLLIWAVCAAPVVASYLSYYVVKPQGRINHGTLITPPKPMAAEPGLAFTDLQGQAVAPQALQGQWLLVSVAGGACDAACERQLYLQRQLREVLGRDKDRVDRVWLIPDQAEVRPALLPALAQAWTLRVDAARLSQWLQADAGQTLSSHLYLVDPRGDWMMRFPADADPVRIKKDLMRLLKASESWDEAGR
jgi:cytochrome oxidase Cu insertion factor (SCO1/SenC/PrrC family)